MKSIIIILYVLFLVACKQNKIVATGCTDETAFNYNPAASEDDGSCEYFELESMTEEVAEEMTSTTTETITESVEFTTASGLQYIDHVIGTGDLPETGDRVKVHYTGTLEDGTKFDSSRDRDRPFEFPLGAGRVIKGWDEGIATMRIGGQRKLIIPPDLGYGNRAIGSIPQNSTLIFEVELLDITKIIKDTDFDLPGREIVLDSGLRMIEHISGNGEKPSTGQTVKVHYTGYLQTGAKFDSSHDRGTPFEFPLGQGRVIKGWDEGIAEMSKGSKCTLIIPPDLGYGERGAGRSIPPNATLLFEVELIEFQ